MKHAQALQEFLSGLPPPHRPQPGADLAPKNYAQTLRLLSDFWKRTGKSLGRSLKHDRAKLQTAVSKAYSPLVAWVGRAFPEYLEALKLEGYAKDVLRCAEAWKKAWLQRLHSLAKDALSRPLVSVGIPPRDGSDPPPHPDAPWAVFRGLFGEPGAHNCWPDDAGAPQEFYSVAQHMNGTRHADWIACGGGIPREFHDALARQSRSKWTAWQALDCLLTSRSASDFVLAQHWTTAASVIIFEWTAANQPHGAAVEPISLWERRPEDGVTFGGRYAGAIPWLHDWWKSGAAVTSRDAESFVLCCMALLEHLASTALSPLPASIEIIIRRVKSKPQQKWQIDFNGDNAEVSVGPARLLMELGETGVAENYDERHFTRLVEALPALGTLFAAPGPRKGLRTARDYRAPVLKGCITISDADKLTLRTEFQKSKQGAKNRRRFGVRT